MTENALNRALIVRINNYIQRVLNEESTIDNNYIKGIINNDIKNAIELNIDIDTLEDYIYIKIKKEIDIMYSSLLTFSTTWQHQLTRPITDINYTYNLDFPPRADPDIDQMSRLNISRFT